MAAVPIRARSGDVIGVIVLHTAAPREFTEEDVELLTHTATLVGGAIEDAQLYEEARERVAALTRLAEVSQRLAAATQHERLHEAATAGARALLHADLCQLFRLEPGGSELRLVASDPPERARPAAAGRRAAARAARARAPRRLEPRPVARATRAPRCSRRRSSRPTSSSGCSACCGPRRFGAGDEELLRALADQTAMGLERAELIARLTARDRVKDLFDALADGAPPTAPCSAPRRPAATSRARTCSCTASRRRRRRERRLGGGRDAARRAPARARPGRLLRRRPRRPARRRADAGRRRPPSA